MKIIFITILALIMLLSFGCATPTVTNTKRSAEEQLLCTKAVDLAFEKITFTQVSNKKVFIENKLLEASDKEYLQGTVKYKLVNSGAIISDDKENSDIIVELFSGCVGTSHKKWLGGIPEMGIPVPLAGTVSIPEIAFFKRVRQAGYCKTKMIMVDRKTGKSILYIPLLFGESYHNHFFILFFPFTTSNIL
ncbi:hypothetical protein P0136_05640 [Lentisphaerota bacterium ZTH]|nr:hypothetical protein JYG24_03250 [Lentisphaerota bacterium]WET07473.1 hypothetical protein P0136_05640 [Lentisphaerota bacterium ZTH]